MAGGKPVVQMVFDGMNTFPPSPGIECKEPGARQADAAACDINNIVKQYDRNGVMPMVDIEGLYVDVSQVGDYRQALERVRLADKFFMALPVEVRARFKNDPAEFLDFSSDEANRSELMSILGVPAAVPPVVPPAAAAPPAAGPSGA